MCGQQSAGQVSPSIFWCFSALYWCVSTILLYPDLYLWLTPLGMAGGRETGCMSMSRWGPGSSHEWGPQLANSVILVICLIVFRTKKEISCDWWVSNGEGSQLSVSPKWRMPLWSLECLSPRSWPVQHELCLLSLCAILFGPGSEEVLLVTTDSLAKLGIVFCAASTFAHPPPRQCSPTILDSLPYLIALKKILVLQQGQR